MRRFPFILAVCAFLAASAGRSFADVAVNAYLYNPNTDSLTLRYPYPREAEHHRFSPFLVLAGTGAADGAYRLRYSLEGGGKTLFHGTADLEVKNGLFATEIKLDRRYPKAERVRWTISGGSAAKSGGVAALAWSRFHGRVKFRNPEDRADASIDMHPLGFGAPGRIVVPLDPDGGFDLLVPARVYRVVNVNSTGYCVNSLERWAWDYDLTRDREDEFTIGRMEIYSVRAFEIIGGPATLFVSFRPSTLTRVLRFDSNRNGRLDPEELRAVGTALKESCTAIGPELTAEDVTVLIDGKPYPVVQLTRVPEYGGDGSYQVQYLLQVYPEHRLGGLSHEITVRVEELDGRKILDWGEGTVGYYPLGYGAGLL
jgi:hypothetical protein